MTNGELAFLALAEELNFTRAAERIYMSQQGLSDHIRRLEQEYETTLVTRRPRVELTASGSALYRMLTEKNAMEKDLQRMIRDIDHGDVGTVSVGISTSRVRVFASDILQRFHESHPRVRVNIVSELTVTLLQMLRQGELDLVVGVEPEPDEEFRIEPIFEDPVYFAVPDRLAAERTGSETRVDIRKYADLPFIRDLQDSTTCSMIDRFLAQQNIFLNNLITVSDYNVQAALCNRLNAAMFCSHSFAFFSEGEVVRKGLRVLGIKGLHQSVSICMITSANWTYPRCVTEFEAVVCDSLHRFSERNLHE